MSAIIPYNTSPARVGDRIAIHPACDLWMKGDRYAEVIERTPDGKVFTIKTDHGTTTKIDWFNIHSIMER